jgi:hypothetical protein
MQHDFILLDRSGSMQTLWTEALGSINGYVQKLAESGVDTGVTLACFDLADTTMSFDILRDRITPSTWRPVSDADANPRGSTPLNDAVGKIVALAEAHPYDKVAIIIMTDGHENASKELSVDQAKAALDRCRAKGWQVIFLGANFDNAKQAAGYGNSSFATASVARQNLFVATTNVAASRAVYATTGAPMGFTDAQKQDLAQSNG